MFILGACGGILMTADSPAFIFSPGWPENYLHNQECTWLIRSPESTVEFNLLYLDMEDYPSCYFDSLVIRDGEDSNLTRVKCSDGHTLKCVCACVIFQARALCHPYWPLCAGESSQALSIPQETPCTSTSPRTAASADEGLMHPTPEVRKKCCKMYNNNNDINTCLMHVYFSFGNSHNYSQLAPLVVLFFFSPQDMDFLDIYSIQQREQTRQKGIVLKCPSWSVAILPMKQLNIQSYSISYLHFTVTSELSTLHCLTINVIMDMWRQLHKRCHFSMLD